MASTASGRWVEDRSSGERAILPPHERARRRRRDRRRALRDVHRVPAVPPRRRARDPARARRARRRRLRPHVRHGAPPLLQRRHRAARDARLGDDHATGARRSASATRATSRPATCCRCRKRSPTPAATTSRGCAALGLDTTFVEPAEIAEIEPLLALDGIAGAAYEPDGGFADAHKMILGWFAAASRTASCRGSAAPSRRSDRRGRPRARRATRPTATSPATASCSRPAPGRIELLRPPAPSADRPQAHAGLGAAPARRRAAPQRRCSDAVTNVVVRPDRGALFCAVTYFGDEPLDARRRLRPRHLAGLRGRDPPGARRALPGLAGSTGARLRGPYDYSPDWNPIIGACPGIEGLYLALAWSGHGFKLSPAVGEVVAAEVRGGRRRSTSRHCAPRGSRKGRCCAWHTGPAHAPRKTPFAAPSAARSAMWQSGRMVAATSERLERVSAERRARWLRRRRRRRALWVTWPSRPRRSWSAVWPRGGTPLQRAARRPGALRRHGLCPSGRRPAAVSH